MRHIDDYGKPPASTTHKAELTTQYIDGNGKRCFKGGKDLNKSQHYPRRFGENVQKLWLRHEADLRAWATNTWDTAARTPLYMNDIVGDTDWNEFHLADLTEAFEVLLNGTP